MNKCLSFIAGTVGFVVWTAAPAPLKAAPLGNGLVARVHFAGGDTVAANPNYGPLKNVWSSPAALAMKAQTLDKLDHFLDVWLRQQIAPNMGNAPQVRPLLADLVASEWQLDLYQPAGDTVEFSLAVRLGNARTQAWLATLTPMVSAWNKTSPAHHGQLQHSGNWLFLQLGNSSVPAPAAAIAGLGDQWLKAEVDWVRLATLFPALRNFDLPHTRLEVTGRAGNFEINGDLTLSQPLPPLEKWQFPTNTIHSPFISFTAVRGISDWLKQQPWAASLGISPLPNQLFAWVMPSIPYQTYAAMPLAAAPAALPKIDEVLTADLQAAKADSPDSPYRHFNLSETVDQVSLSGLPLLAPYIQAVHEASGEFLLAGFFPNSPRGKPVPAPLLARLDEPGLVYYHWEATAERMKLFPRLYQLLLAMTRHYQVEATSPPGKWLAEVVTNLGPTVTVAVEKSPTELDFTRQAPAGLTAIELVALASWLQAPDFPGCDLRMPPPRIHPHHPPGTKAPVPFVLHH
jgi:hypothetical protein